MTRPATTPGTIVVGYDRSDAARRALHWAAGQAAVENRILTVAHVITPTAGFELTALGAFYLAPDLLNQALREDGTNMLAEARAAVAKEFPGVSVATVLREGAPGHVLVELSGTAASLVIGSRGRGRVATALLGSVGVEVSRSADCPVVVVRPHNPGKVRRGVLVGTDCREQSRPTVEFAHRQASWRNQPLTVLYCVGNLDGPANSILDDHAPGVDEHRRLLAESVSGMAEDFPDVHVQLRIGNGLPDRCLVEASESMDLVVVGHHQRAAFGDLVGLGSFAPSVVEGAKCPVAVVCQMPVAEGVPK